MGIFDKMKNFLPNNYGDEAGYEDDYSEEQDEEMVQNEVRPREVKQQPVYGARPSETGGVAIASRNSSIEMRVVSPTRFDEVDQISDLLLRNITVLLNLENTNKETTKRLIDFLSGVAYALNGEVQKVADNAYVVTPNNVAVSSETLENSQAQPQDTGIYE